PEPVCVVPGIVTEGLNILAGRPKSCKSWLVLDVGIAVAEGGRVFGLEVEQGDVLYLALEDNKRRLKSRMKKLMGKKRWPARLVLANCWHRMDAGGLDMIEGWLESKEVKTPRLVIIDTVARFKPRQFRSRNLYDEDYSYMGEIKQLADKYEVGILA